MNYGATDLDLRTADYEINDNNKMNNWRSSFGTISKPDLKWVEIFIDYGMKNTSSGLIFAD